MKIGIIGPAYPYRGGMAAFNERLAREFQSQGHEVIIHTFTFQYPSFLFPGKTQYSEAKPPGDLNIVRDIHALNPINWLRVRKALKKEKYDLIVPAYWLPLMGPCLGTILKGIPVPRVCVVHNIIPHESRPGDKLFSKYFVRSADAFLCLTESVQKDLNTFDQDKPKLVSPHPVYDSYGSKKTREESLAYLNLDPDFSYILFFGLIREYKGLDLLLQAFADRRLQQMPLRLVIAGEYYAKKEEYLALIKKLGIGDAVIQVDKFIPDHEIAYYFGLSDLVVQPYKSATQSGVTQIAYHFNVPMVVTDVGGLKEMCPDEKVGFVVEPKPEPITDAILRFYEESWKSKMQQHILEEKKKLSWQVLTDNIFELYDRIRPNTHDLQK